MISTMMDENFEFAGFRLFPKQRALYHGADIVPIGGRGFDLLLALVSRAGSVLSAKELIGYAWPGVTVEHSNLRVQIASLRKALSCCEDGCRAIETVSVRGYCFALPVLFHSAGSACDDGSNGTGSVSFSSGSLGRVDRTRTSSGVSIGLDTVKQAHSGSDALQLLDRAIRSSSHPQLETAINKDIAALFAYLLERIAFEISCEIDSSGGGAEPGRNRHKRLDRDVAKSDVSRTAREGRSSNVLVRRGTVSSRRLPLPTEPLLS